MLTIISLVSFFTFEIIFVIVVGKINMVIYDVKNIITFILLLLLL